MLSWLQLLRLPTVFTAIPDIVLGSILTSPGHEFSPTASFFALLGSSIGLYLGGMVLNDVCDVGQDRMERPQRPIPSGRVSWTAALALGSLLLLIGLGLAFVVRPTVSGVIAIVLAAMVVGYDAILKRTVLGPLAMGSCRLLNVLLGASLGVDSVGELLTGVPLGVAAAFGAYIVGVTWFARTEARVSSRGALGGALAIINVGLAILVGLMLTGANPAQAQAPLLLVAMIAASLNVRAITAIRTATPETVQPLIKLFLLNYVTLSATAVYWQTGDAMLLLGTACLVLPAIFLSRAIPMT